MSLTQVSISKQGTVWSMGTIKGQEEQESHLGQGRPSAAGHGPVSSERAGPGQPHMGNASGEGGWVPGQLVGARPPMSPQGSH